MTKKETCGNLYKLKEEFKPAQYGSTLRQYVYLIDADVRTVHGKHWRYAKYMIIGEEGFYHMSKDTFFDFYDLVTDEL